MIFADKLKQLREEKGWSQKQLAERAGLSFQAVVKWEQGDRKPTFEAVIKLCKALGVRCTVFEGCDFGEAENKPGRGRPKKG